MSEREEFSNRRSMSLFIPAMSVREREREKGLYSCAADIFVDENTWMSFIGS